MFKKVLNLLTKNFVGKTQQKSKIYGGLYNNTLHYNALRRFNTENRPTKTPVITPFNDPGKREIKVGFVGAGAVNFGGAEGPWDHSKRLEQLHDERFGNFKVVGLCDPDNEKAKKILGKKKVINPDIYNDCKIYSDWKDMVNDEYIDCIIVGTPPFLRGGVYNNLEDNIEYVCVKKGIDMFVEKPVGLLDPELMGNYAVEVNKVQSITESRYNNTRNPFIFVAYMFRYHQIFEEVFNILKRNNNPKIFNINLNYHCAYPYIKKSFWWDVNRSGGPIIEQATHFVDISRFITNNSVHSKESLNVNIIPMYDGILNSFDDEFKRELYKIKLEDRNPVLTTSTWKFNNYDKKNRNDFGTMVSLTHSINLHHQKYQNDLTILADGLLIYVKDPYSMDNAILNVQQTSNNIDLPMLKYQTIVKCDPYYHQFKSFVKGLYSESNEESKEHVRSDFNDAYKTHQLTWDIKHLSRYT